jgi:hypothetical protein
MALVAQHWAALERYQLLSIGHPNFLFPRPLNYIRSGLPYQNNFKPSPYVVKYLHSILSRELTDVGVRGYPASRKHMKRTTDAYIHHVSFRSGRRWIPYVVALTDG